MMVVCVLRDDELEGGVTLEPVYQAHERNPRRKRRAAY
ncbi:MAG: hypothetical protein ACI9MC_003634 [Kiritimatiellia bacterium]|jgi:hypothetical protein